MYTIYSPYRTSGLQEWNILKSSENKKINSESAIFFFNLGIR